MTMTTIEQNILRNQQESRIFALADRLEELSDDDEYSDENYDHPAFNAVDFGELAISELRKLVENGDITDRERAESYVPWHPGCIATWALLMFGDRSHLSASTPEEISRSAQNLLGLDDAAAHTLFFTGAFYYSSHLKPYEAANVLRHYGDKGHVSWDITMHVCGTCSEPWCALCSPELAEMPMHPCDACQVECCPDDDCEKHPRNGDGDMVD